ncbi:hypothetical protein Tsubulata_007269 [Turnera subulata]|uniref:Ribulose bisphosphate carboxylase large chain n=1 Tax=Turnera subulata TaxID=218843 RepID=A0A9Q0GI26_9ROSI|nr:hypothetical protein Tsubulata_007269 [Turnera subulata]
MILLFRSMLRIQNRLRWEGMVAKDSEGDGRSRNGGLALLWKDDCTVSLQSFSMHHSKVGSLLACYKLGSGTAVSRFPCSRQLVLDRSDRVFIIWSKSRLTGVFLRRCYDLEPVAGEENQYIAYVAYPLDLFEEGSVTNMFTSIVGLEANSSYRSCHHAAERELV